MIGFSDLRIPLTQYLLTFLDNPKDFYNLPLVNKYFKSVLNNNLAKQLMIKFYPEYTEIAKLDYINAIKLFKCLSTDNLLTKLEQRNLLLAQALTHAVTHNLPNDVALILEKTVQCGDQEVAAFKYAFEHNYVEVLSKFFDIRPYWFPLLKYEKFKLAHETKNTHYIDLYLKSLCQNKDLVEELVKEEFFQVYLPALFIHTLLKVSVNMNNSSVFCKSYSTLNLLNAEAEKNATLIDSIIAFIDEKKMNIQEIHAAIEIVNSDHFSLNALEKKLKEKKSPIEIIESPQALTPQMVEKKRKKISTREVKELKKEANNFLNLKKRKK